MARTYGELKRRVQLLIDRDDAEEQIAADNTEVDMLDVFLANAEKRFYRSEAARIPPLEKRIEFVVSNGTGVAELAIPGDYFETRYLTAFDSETKNQVTLERTSPERILNVNTSQQNYYLPTKFAYGNNRWIIQRPSQQATVEANYYGFLKELDMLVEDTDHWILNNADDLIMYWAAVEASLYYGSLTDMSQIWDARAELIKQQIIEQEIRQQSSGSTPTQRRFYRAIN